MDCPERFSKIQGFRMLKCLFKKQEIENWVFSLMECEQKKKKKKTRRKFKKMLKKFMSCLKN